MIKIKETKKTKCKKFEEKDFPVAIQGDDGLWIFGRFNGGVYGTCLSDGEKGRMVNYDTVSEFNDDIMLRNDTEVDLDIIIVAK